MADEKARFSIKKLTGPEKTFSGYNYAVRYNGAAVYFCNTKRKAQMYIDRLKRKY